MEHNEPYIAGAKKRRFGGAKKIAKKYVPEVFLFLQYYRAVRVMGNSPEQAAELFDAMIEESHGPSMKCLQIGVKEKDGAKYGENWVSVDRYDPREFIDYHYDINDMKFSDDEFDIAVCLSILEHIPNPQQAISEFFRVLKPGGRIWVQMPFHYPYHQAPKDYWRASPDGMRVWMSEFEEIECGSFTFNRTALATSTFFYGRKPLANADSTEME